MRENITVRQNVCDVSFLCSCGGIHLRALNLPSLLPFNRLRTTQPGDVSLLSWTSSCAETSPGQFIFPHHMSANATILPYTTPGDHSWERMILCYLETSQFTSKLQRKYVSTSVLLFSLSSFTIMRVHILQT